MRPQFFELRCLFPVLLVGVLMLSTRLLCAQGTPPSGVIPVPLFDPPIQFVPGPEADAPPSRLRETLPLDFQAIQAQTQSPLRLFPRYTGYPQIPLDDQAGLQPPRPAGTAEWLGGTKDSAGSASSRWFTVTPAFGKPSDSRIRSAADLEHYSRRIPLAGPIILRVQQRVKTHPQVTRVLRLLAPAAQ